MYVQLVKINIVWIKYIILCICGWLVAMQKRGSVLKVGLIYSLLHEYFLGKRVQNGYLLRILSFIDYLFEVNGDLITQIQFVPFITPAFFCILCPGKICSTYYNTGRCQGWLYSRLRRSLVIICLHKKNWEHILN